LEFGLGHIEYCMGRRTGLRLLELFSCVKTRELRIQFVCYESEKGRRKRKEKE
jgi:hypothetical protein